MKLKTLIKMNNEWKEDTGLRIWGNEINGNVYCGDVKNIPEWILNSSVKWFGRFSVCIEMKIERAKF